MEYGILGLCICFGALGYAEISKLKRQIKVQKEQIFMLCERTGNQELLPAFIPDDLKQDIRRLKEDGREAAVVRKIRAAASIDLLAAKQYVDKL